MIYYKKKEPEKRSHFFFYYAKNNNKDTAPEEIIDADIAPLTEDAKAQETETTGKEG